MQVTVGMWLVGALPLVRACLLFFTQILGGMAAAALVSCLFPGSMNVQTALGGGTSIVQGLFIEMFLTAELVFTIFMLAAEKHKGTFIAPVGIGLSLFIAELSGQFSHPPTLCRPLLTLAAGVYYTGGSLNPARSFGPSVVLRQFYHYHWIYWIGPLLGSLLASGFYMFIKMLEYETANPGQDLDDKEAQVFNPEVSTERPNVSLHADHVARPDGQVQLAADGRQGRGAGTGTGGDGTHGQPRAHAHSNSRGRSDRVDQRRRSREHAYYTSEGPVNYPPRSSHDSYRRGPDVESGRYMPHSAGHR